ncbi:MAG: hypothetical protein JWP69_55 [Flaviaesturariibacter sp.]|nr:hypothetical protein [Flaviaesturariibacter sp.]
MHYIFERRLNMLDVAINDLKEKDIADAELPMRLAEEHRMEIPELDLAKAEYKVKKERLTSDTAPKDFHIRHGEEYSYMTATFPFTDDAYIRDILTLQKLDEGLTITPKEVIYKEYSHSPFEEGSEEYLRIKANARKAVHTVELSLDEVAAEAAEFNQVYLPAAIKEKLAYEKVRRQTVPQSES